MTPMDRAGYRISFCGLLAENERESMRGRIVRNGPVLSLPHYRYLGPQELQIRAMSV